MYYNIKSINVILNNKKLNNQAMSANTIISNRHRMIPDRQILQKEASFIFKQTLYIKENFLIKEITQWQNKMKE